MFSLINVFILKSLDKYFGDGIFPSDNVTWFFWGYIGVGTLLVDLYESSSSVGFYVAQRKKYEKRQIIRITDDKLTFKKIT